MKKLLSIISLIFVLSITTNAQFLNTTEIINSDCRIQFLNSNGIKVYELIGENLTWWKQSSGAIIIRDKVTQVTIPATYNGTPALSALDDSLDAWILSCKDCCSGGGDGGGCLESCTLAADVDIEANGKYVDFQSDRHAIKFNNNQSLGAFTINLDGFTSISSDSSIKSFSGNFKAIGVDSMHLPAEISTLNDPFMGSGQLLYIKTEVSGGNLNKTITATDGTTGISVAYNKDGIEILPDIVMSGAMAYDVIHVNNFTDKKEIKLRADGSITHNGAYANTSYVIDGTPGGFTIPDNVSYAIYNPTSIQASATIIMPENPFDGQLVTISFGGNILSGTVVTSLLVSPNTAQSLVIGSIGSTGLVEQPFSLIWAESVSKWFLVSH